MQFHSGQQFYKYHLKNPIGEGSFGRVWLADDRSVGCECAIKILKPEVNISNFFREAQIGHRFNHTNVVRVHYADIVRHDKTNYPILVMDYLANGSVTHLANLSSFLELPQVIQLGRDILSGLGYLHDSNLVHRDIKPGNVLTGTRGQGMINDYGITGQLQNGTLSGPTPVYTLHVAPEVLNRNPFTVQTDIYQVGLTLFRMLVGLDWLSRKHTKLGENAYRKAVIDGNLISRSDFPAYVPNRLCRIILKAVNSDLTKRFSSALEMRRELEKLEYPGYWTVTDDGEYVGHNGNYEYSFEKKKIARTRYDIVARRRHNNSQRITCCTKFCGSNLTNSKANRGYDRFVRAVVEKDKI